VGCLSATVWLRICGANAHRRAAVRGGSRSAAVATAHKLQKSKSSTTCFSGGPGSVKRMGARAGSSRGCCRSAAAGFTPAMEQSEQRTAWVGKISPQVAVTVSRIGEAGPAR
jgi:hypothetical protein